MSALVGESGSGKTVAAWSMLGLPLRPGKIIEGEVFWYEENILKMTPEQLNELRGKEIGLILSSPKIYLHPLVRVGKQIQEVYMAHHDISKSKAYEIVLDIISNMGLSDSPRIFNSYSFELSGGMAQRIMIAMALVNSPELVIADDSTNGLDVTIQRQILDLMSDLIKQRNSSALMITHDLGIVAQYCKNVAIMYAGQTIEKASVNEIFSNPLHPYSQSLIGSIRSTRLGTKGKPIPGIAPDPKNLPSGCLFEPRCSIKMPECKKDQSPMIEVEKGHFVRCLRYSEKD